MANLFLILALCYLTAGFLFALVFAFRWVGILDEQSKGAPVMFRLLIIPGSTLLWIYLLFKLREKRKL